MSNFTMNELKTLVLSNVNADQVREYGDLRRRSTWERAYTLHVSVVLEPVQVTDEDLAAYTIDGDYSDNLLQEQPVAQTTEQPVSFTVSVIATVIAGTDTVYNFAEAAVPVVKQAWTKAEPVLFQGLFFTVVLAIFFYWFVASATVKVYLALEWSILSLAFTTVQHGTDPVADGRVLTDDGPLLLCEAS
jgi:hypothetical protein